MFTKECPKCQFIVANDALDCPRCGVIFDRIRDGGAPSPGHDPRPAPGPRTDLVGRQDLGRPGSTDLALTSFLAPSALYIDQFAHHWWEILFNFEQRNEYQVCDERGRMLGNIVEQGSGFLAGVTRVFLGSHRPLDVKVFDARSQIILQFARKFSGSSRA